jgi:hypothetical protein
VNQTEKQHVIAIDLLQRLGLDNIKLKAEGNDYYAYFAWTKPQIAHNGSPSIVKRGKIKVPA